MVRGKIRRASALLGALGLMAAASAALAAPGEITIKDTGVFPESLTSDAAGNVFIGSSAKGGIYRAAAGATEATLWIDPQTSGVAALLGVFADDKSNTLYACSVAFGAPPEKADSLSNLRTFDLKTGVAKRAYPMPGGGKSVCNDIAVGRDGTTYVAETGSGRILRLKKGASALEEWIKDPLLAGADGIAIGGDGAVYVNSVTASRLFRVAVGAGGAAGAITELTPSLKLDGPDGMRAIGGNRFLLAEGKGGRISEVVVVGDQAIIAPLKTNDPGVTAVTLTGGKVWFVNAKFDYRRNPALKGKDPNPFVAESISLPGR